MDNKIITYKVLNVATKKLQIASNKKLSSLNRKTTLVNTNLSSIDNNLTALNSTLTNETLSNNTSSTVDTSPTVDILSSIDNHILLSNEHLSTSNGHLLISNSNLSTINGNISASNESLSTINGNISASNVSLSTINGNISASNESLSTINGNISASNVSLSTINGNISASNLNLSTINGNISAGNESLSIINGNISAGNESLSLINGNISAGNESLSTINGNISAINLGISTGNDNLSTIGGYISTSNLNLSAINSSISAGNNVLSSIDDKLSSDNVFLASIDNKLPSIGQKTKTVSMPVVIASDQPAIDMTMIYSSDLFGRLKISNPYILFDSKLLSTSTSLLYWDDKLISGSGGSSVYDNNKSCQTLSVGTAVCMRVRQSFQRFHYVSGKSQLILMSGIIGNPVIGVTKRLGYFDDNNGIFFQSAGNTISIGIRTSVSGSVSDTIIDQNAWNIDIMGGSGISGILLDWTKTLIFIMTFQWLGVGVVKFGVNVNGINYFIHQVNNSNILTNVYMKTPSLPIRYEINNTGSTEGASLVQICTSVVSEGGHLVSYINRGIYRTIALQTLNSSDFYPLITMKLQSSNLGAIITVKKIAIVCTTTTTFIWKLCLNPIFAGTSLAFTDINSSNITANLTSTNATTITGGVDLDAGVILQNASSGELTLSENTYNIGSTIEGTSHVLCLAVSRLTGTTETFYASLTFSDNS
jgi:hypothetical protein